MTDYIDIPGFELMDRIGEGQVAQVWSARQLSLDRMVALKIFHDDFLVDDTSVERMLDEARTAGRLKHPGLVTLYDAGEAAGRYYFVLEYVEGQTLEDYVASHGPLSDTDAIAIAAHVSHALDYAWNTAALVHGNVSPGNILMDEHGRVKLADLGMARSSEHAGTTMVRTSNAPDASRHYASPEQLRGIPMSGCESDIFSLGTTLYYLLTGEVPFSHETGGDSEIRTPDSDLPDPRDLRRDLPEALGQFITRLTMMDPQDRYRDWPHALLDIQFLSEQSTPATTQATPRRTSKAKVSVKGPSRARKRMQENAEFAHVQASKASPAAIAVSWIIFLGMLAWFVFLAMQLLDAPAPFVLPDATP